MHTFEVIAVRVLPMAFQVHTLKLEASNPELSMSLFAFVNQSPTKWGDCFFIDSDTLSPITFDFTCTSKSHINSEIKSDYFTCTYNELVKQVERLESEDRFISNSQPFCRVIRSKSGKAGQFFSDHDQSFSKSRQDKNEPFRTSVFHNEDFYFENLRGDK